MLMNDNYREPSLYLIRRYVPLKAQTYVLGLPIPIAKKELSVDMAVIVLPEWAMDIIPKGHKGLVIPRCALAKPDDFSWDQVDWFRAIFDMATSQVERKIERESGPVHSYSFRLPSELNVMFSHAWVNRIALFLRRWAARVAGGSEIDLFGIVPKGKVYLTHDVDYVSKTSALRLKQTVFNVFNILKSLCAFDFCSVLQSSKKAVSFLLGKGGYWQFEKITELESKYDVKSYWNFYGGINCIKASLLKTIMDPSYDVCKAPLSIKLNQLRDNGHIVGLHQSFFSWNDGEVMRHEKDYIEQAVDNYEVETCRQHWLRFSFADTWGSQETAGMKLDMTLGFNDIIGFRNAAAIRMPYWCEGEGRFSRQMETVPMVLMDSHLFDYGQSNGLSRRKLIDDVLNEVSQTGGEVSIIWHQRVFHQDYGWGDDYEYLLQRVIGLGLV